jgi:hypothetical protein
VTNVTARESNGAGPRLGPGTISDLCCARLLAAPAAARPGTNTLSLQHIVRDPDLLLATSVMGRSAATTGTPGAHGELQPAVVAVTGVDGPVAARLARRDGVPVHTAVRIRGTGRQRHRRQGERPRDSGQPERSADVSHFFPFAKRAPTTPAGAGAAAVEAGELGRAVSVRHGRGGEQITPPGVTPGGRRKAIPPFRGPTHTQVRGLKLFAHLLSRLEPTNGSRQSHIG